MEAIKGTNHTSSYYQGDGNNSDQKRNRKRYKDGKSNMTYALTEDFERGFNAFA